MSCKGLAFGAILGLAPTGLRLWGQATSAVLRTLYQPLSPIRTVPSAPALHRIYPPWVGSRARSSTSGWRLTRPTAPATSTSPPVGIWRPKRLTLPRKRGQTDHLRTACPMSADDPTSVWVYYTPEPFPCQNRVGRFLRPFRRCLLLPSPLTSATSRGFCLSRQPPAGEPSPTLPEYPRPTNPREVCPRLCHSPGHTTPQT